MKAPWTLDLGSWTLDYYSLMHSPTRLSALDIGGRELRLDDAEGILRGRISRLTLTAAARRRMQQPRECLESMLRSGATIYGVNTGFGKLANQRIEAEEVLSLQENLLRS